MDLLFVRDDEPRFDRVKHNGRTIGVLRLDGILAKAGGDTSTVRARQILRDAARDSSLAAIVLAFDSPGGTVAGTADLAAEVRAAQRQKPVWAFLEDSCCGVAYWIASQCGRVYANDDTALVGSVGVVNVVYDLSAAAEKAGVKTLAIGTGPLKGAGVPGAAVTEEQQAHFRGIVEDAQKSFDAAVQNGRRLTGEQLASVKSGAAFGATEATNRGLIDGVRTLEYVLTYVTNPKGAGEPRTAPSSAQSKAPLVPVKFAAVAGPVELSTDLDPLALHEAAHAVVARSQGLPIASVMIGPEKGVCRFGVGATDHPARCAVAAMAGPMLDVFIGVPMDHNAHDYNLAAAFVEDYRREAGRDMPDNPVRRAREWLTFPAAVAAVNRVAAALEKNRELTGPQLDAIISTVDAPAEPRPTEGWAAWFPN